MVDYKRKRVVAGLVSALLSRKRHRLMNWLLCDGDLFDPLLLLSESRLKMHTELTKTTRYIDDRQEYRNLDTNARMEAFLEETKKDGSRTYFNHAEFKNEYGMSRVAFWRLHNMIHRHPVFKSKTNFKRRPQMPVSHQLLEP